MRRRRFLCFLVVLVLGLRMVGCGYKEDEDNTIGSGVLMTEDVYSSEDDATEMTDAEWEEFFKQQDWYKMGQELEVKSKAESEAGKQSNAEPVDLEEATFTWTDFNGYTFKATYGLSDWIADEQTLKVTWDKVSNGKPQPDFSENMPLGDFMKYNGRIYGHETNEITYLIGYFEVENVTSNFAITETNPVEIIIELYTNTPYAMLQTSSGNIFLPNWTATPDITTDGLYKKGDGFFGDGIYCTMKSDRISRTPFIIALSISATPNKPEGAPNPAQVTVAAKCYDWSSKERPEHIFTPKIPE